MDSSPTKRLTTTNNSIAHTSLIAHLPRELYHRPCVRRKAATLVDFENSTTIEPVERPDGSDTGAMAYRCSLSTRATLVARAYNPSFSYILRDHDRKEDSPDSSLSQREIHNFIQQRSFGSRLNNSYGSGGAFFQGKGVLQFSLGSSAGSAFCRYMLTTVGEGSDKIELKSDLADVLTYATTQVVANHAPAVNEVTIAAADSFLPVAALQHVIDAVHNFTGLNWWASIIITTLLIQSATFPLLINQLKATSKLTGRCSI
ncbi:hypothetical protein QYF36_017780 [Acer negundo]|nr:hypothetical protein QYF36_017780 [Acer negundo]